MTARLHHFLAAAALILAGIFVLMARVEEASLCVLFSLACLHQAKSFGSRPRQDGVDRLLFAVLRHLDEVKRKLR